VPIVSAAFLLAVGRALVRIRRARWSSAGGAVHLIDPLAGQIGEGGKVLSPAQPLRLEAATWLAEAAKPVIARSPTTQRIAGSRDSLSASFTSS